MSMYLEFQHGARHFDSRIEHPGAVDLKEPFQFFLEMRVHLRQLNPMGDKKTDQVVDSDNHATTIIPWDTASWLHFKVRYMKLVTQVWDKAFLLTPPKNYDGFVWPRVRGTRRDLLCRLRMKLRLDPALAHISIPVVRLQNPGAHSFRDDSRHYSSDMDAPRTNFFDGSKFQQSAPAHEVGHLLGFINHVNSHDPTCLSNSEPSCYGSNLVQRMNIMGAGNKLWLVDAKPWHRRIHAHAPPTHYNDWTPSWASADAILRGDGNRFIDEQIPRPPFRGKAGLIDL